MNYSYWAFFWFDYFDCLDANYFLYDKSFLLELIFLLTIANQFLMSSRYFTRSSNPCGILFVMCCMIDSHLAVITSHGAGILIISCVMVLYIIIKDYFCFLRCIVFIEFIFLLHLATSSLWYSLFAIQSSNDWGLSTVLWSLWA